LQHYGYHLHGRRENDEAVLLGYQVLRGWWGRGVDGGGGGI
jgi:hypothetical protein